jgi:hypothetical protein
MDAFVCLFLFLLDAVVSVFLFFSARKYTALLDRDWWKVCGLLG